MQSKDIGNHAKLCRNWKLIFFSRTGKSAFLSRFAGKKFSANYVGTIGTEFATKEVIFEGKPIRLQVKATNY